MESEKHLIENEVSGPLKHLFSIELEALPDSNTVAEDVKFNNKPFKQIKRVRFSDVVSQSYLETYEAESSIDVENRFNCSDNNEFGLSDFEDQYTDFSFRDDVKVERSNIEDNSKTLLSSSELKCSFAECENSSDQYNKTGDVLICKETLDISSEIKNTDEVYEDDIVKEIAAICISSDSSSIEFDTQFNDSEGSKIRKNKSEFILLKKIKSNENLRFQKQSEKINSLLKPYRNKFLTLPEKKSIVFEAWNTVKKKEVNHVMKQQMKANQIKEEKSSHSYKCTPREEQPTRKKVKLRKKTNELSKEMKNLLNNAQQRMSKEDMEEKEMAFKSWKRNKEEMIKQQVKIDNEKKQQHKLSVLRNEQVKKKSAESAYLSWKAHKEELSKKEKMKRNWLKQKDSHFEELKIQQNKRALELYRIWLDNKHFHKKDNFSFVEDRPAWLPPGKAKLK